jgi:hypothetical protein
LAPRWPNFLIAGAARSGTTALHALLSRHPEVFLPARKEPHFFAFAGRAVRFRGPGDAATINRVAVTGVDDYRQLFARAGSARAVGEASVSTLYYPRALVNIERFLQDARVLVILRDPVERAFSSFQYMRSMCREPLPNFAAALEAEEGRIRGAWHHIWHYRALGYYHRQLAPFYERLGPERIHVLLAEDLRSNPATSLKRVFDFLEVDPATRVGSTPRANLSGRPRSKMLARLLLRSTWPRRAALSLLPGNGWIAVDTALRRCLLAPQQIPDRAAAELRESYREDLLALEELLDRDLSRWLRPPGEPK